MNQGLQDRIKTCRSLPTLPAAAIHVLQLAQRPNASLDDLAAVIAEDPALSSSLLRAVNSSFYGLSQRVTAVPQAVVLLGTQSVRALVLGFSLIGTLKGGEGRGFNHLAFWRRSMYAAAAARVLADRVMPDKADDCFVAALLMDLGTLVLDRVVGEPYGEVCDRAATHADLLILETHALGMTHAEAGALLARQWKLPEELEVPMGAHHGPQTVEDPGLRAVTELVALAGRCADVFVNQRPADTIAEVRATLLSRYGIDEASADALLCAVGEKTGALAPLFEVKLNAAASYQCILEGSNERLLEISLARRPNPAPAVNKRRAARLRRDGKILITPCANGGRLGTPMQVRIKDLSANGIGIVHTHRLERGVQFVIELPQADGATKSLLYTVTRCEPGAAGLSTIGAQLAAVLKPQRSGRTQAA